MTTELLELHKVEFDRNGVQRENQSSAVDIVAVHGLNDSKIEAWADTETGKLWLRDFLPESIPIARVLTFGYDASPSSFCGTGCADAIQKHAHTLVASLQADRSIEGCDHRPIIFVCHGLGGLVVKKALSYSASRTSAHVAHLHTIFVSTYGILFFGTPHNSTSIARWSNWKSKPGLDFRIAPKAEKHSDTAVNGDSVTLEIITDQFAPLMKQFRIFFFWEEVRTQFGSRFEYVVKQSSAAPLLDSTERSGIDATHSQMVKFSTRNCSSYRTVIAALSRYCSEAPIVIGRRWVVAHDMLARARKNEAFELTGLDFGISDNHLTHHRKGPLNKHFHPPQETVADFVGREDISDILAGALLLPETKTPVRRQKRFVVYGMGGSGKTQICSKFARDNKDRYWAIFTIQATSPETASDSFAGIGKKGGLEATESAGKHWISQLEEPWLLIIDNADNPNLDIPSFFPESDKGHVLITTRNPDFRRHGTSGSVNLKGLKEQEALQLLFQRAGISSPWDASTETIGNQITRALGYLALAIIQAGTSIFRNICGLKDYLTFHERYRSRRRDKPTSSAAQDENAVYSTFDLSLSYIQNRDTVESQDAIELLNILGFYHFEHIPVELFMRAVENRQEAHIAPTSKSISSRFLTGVAKRLQPPPAFPQFLRDDLRTLDPYRVRLALHELHSLSLISYDGKDASFSLHPLVHAWVRDRLNTGEKGLWAQIALNTLAESILLPPNDGGETHGEFRKDLLPHLDFCLASRPIDIPDYSGWVGKLQIASGKLFRQTLLFTLRDQALCAAKCGYVYAERGRFEKATKYLSMVKDILIQMLGYENERTMTAMLALAGICWGLGRLEEAIELQSRVVEARLKVFGPEHRETLLAMDQLGRSYWLHGQYHEALRLHQLTTDRMKATLGAEENDTLAALDNLGVALGSWKRYEESIEIHRQVLNARRKKSEDVDLDSLTTMNHLAMALLDLDRLEEAEAIITMVYEERKQRLGKEHPWTLWALCNLAKTRSQMGRLQEAESMLVDGIAAGKRSLSEDHLGVLMGMGELARVYTRQRRLCEAEALTLNTVRKIEASRGHEHPDTVYAIWKMAQLNEIQGKVEEAIRSCEGALERAHARLTKQHPLYKKIETKMNVLRKRLEEEEKSEFIDKELDNSG